MSLNDRLRVADELISLNVIEIQDDLLTINRIQDFTWLSSALISGSVQAWAIQDLIQQHDDDNELFNAELLSEIGKRGELAVIDELKRGLDIDLHPRIQHISLKSDRAGFDISAPSLVKTDQTRKLEVKTTCRPGDLFRFFISRNEYEVGCRDPNWRLVFVELRDSDAEILGNLSISALLDRVPIDQDPQIKWKSIQVSVPKSELNQSLP